MKSLVLFLLFSAVANASQSDALIYNSLTYVSQAFRRVELAADRHKDTDLLIVAHQLGLALERLRFCDDISQAAYVDTEDHEFALEIKAELIHTDELAKTFLGQSKSSDGVDELSLNEKLKGQAQAHVHHIAEIQTRVRERNNHHPAGEIFDPGFDQREAQSREIMNNVAKLQTLAARSESDLPRAFDVSENAQICFDLGADEEESQELYYLTFRAKDRDARFLNAARAFEKAFKDKKFEQKILKNKPSNRPVETLWAYRAWSVSYIGAVQFNCHNLA